MAQKIDGVFEDLDEFGCENDVFSVYIYIFIYLLIYLYLYLY